MKKNIDIDWEKEWEEEEWEEEDFSFTTYISDKLFENNVENKITWSDTTSDLSLFADDQVCQEYFENVINTNIVSGNSYSTGCDYDNNWNNQR